MPTTNHSLSTSIHQGAYITSTDPATTYPSRMQTGLLWIDTTATPYTLKKRNAGNNGWDTLGLILDAEAVQDIVGAMVTDSAEIDATYNDGAGTLSLALVAGGVANSKLADMVASRIKGRITSTGAPQDLTGTQVTALLDVLMGDSGSGGTKGLAPAPASGDAAAGKFLKADGTWAVPAGGGSVIVDYKDSCRVATTTNITLSGEQTIDGVSVVAGDRVLVKNQSTASQNGIYVCASGSWTRATDADAEAEVTAGLAVAVTEGTANGDTLWLLTTNDPITVGSTSLSFAQIGGGGAPTGSAGGVLDGSYPNPGLAASVAGAGLSEASDVLSVNVDDATIEINTDALRVKDGGITLAKLADLATQRLLGRNSGSSGVPEAVTVSQVLDWISNTRGALLYRGASGWAALAPGASGYVLKSNGAGADPAYAAEGGGASVTVKDIDGTPTVSATTIEFTNGTVSDQGGGVARITISSGGGGDETAKGAYASAASANDGNVYFPTNGFVVRRDNGSDFDNWGPLFPVVSPEIADFAWVNQGGATAHDTKGGIYILAPASAGDNYRILKQAAPATPYTRTALIMPQLVGTDYCQAGLVWRQASDGKLISFMIVSVSSVWKLQSNKMNSVTSFNSSYFSLIPPPAGAFWLQLEDDGTNRKMKFSLNGQDFIQIHSVGRTDFLTADEVGIFVSSSNGTYDAGCTFLSWS